MKEKVKDINPKKESYQLKARNRFKSAALCAEDGRLNQAIEDANLGIEFATKALKIKDTKDSKLSYDEEDIEYEIKHLKYFYPGASEKKYREAAIDILNNHKPDKILKGRYSISLDKEEKIAKKHGLKAKDSLKTFKINGELVKGKNVEDAIKNLKNK